MRKNLRIAWAFLGVEERRRWALLVLLALVVAGLEAFGASAVYLLIRLIDEPAAATGLPLIGPIGVSLGLEGAALVSGACAAVALFFAAKNALMIGIHAVQYDRIYASANTLATRLLKGYLAAPITFHFARNSAETIRNVGNAVDIVFRIVLTSAVTATTEGLIAAAVLGVLLATAPVETMIAVLVLGAIMGFLMRLTQWRFQAYGEQVQDLSRRGLQSLQQSLGGLKEVKVLGREAYFLGEYADIRATLSKVLWRFDVLSQLPRLALETVFVLAISAVVIYLAWQGGAGKAAVPLVGLYAYAGLRLMPSAHRLVNALNMLRYGSAAIAQIAKDLGQVERDAPPPMPAASPGAFAFGDAIRFEGVSYAYPGTEGRALIGVDLVIPKGASVGIVGPTGSGKSTLIDLVLGLLDPSEGRVTVDGRDIRAGRRAWQDRIGYVPQAFFLTDASLRRNIAFGRVDDEIDAARVDAAIADAQLAETVAGLPQGLETQVGERGVRLSGGQRQRVAIARALYGGPEVLVFDEATSALDNQTEAEIVRAIGRLSGSRTVLIIAHRLSTVKSCDRLVFLKGGRVLDQGTFDELMARNAEFRAMATAAEAP